MKYLEIFNMESARQGAILIQEVLLLFFVYNIGYELPFLFSP